MVTPPRRLDSQRKAPSSPIREWLLLALKNNSAVSSENTSKLTHGVAQDVRCW